MQWFLPFYPSFVAWGLPYHGIARDKTLTTTVGEKEVVLPKKPYAGEVVLVQHAKHKNVDDEDFFTDEQKAYHTANGIEWREYAFLAGRNRMLGGTELYPIPDPPGGDQPTVKQWVYCDENYAWLIGIEVIDYGFGKTWYDVEVTIRGRLVFTAGPDQEEITPRRLALQRVTFLDSAGANSSTSALANPSLVMTHSLDGAKTAVNVFAENCYQDNLDTYAESPSVTQNYTSPYAELAFKDVFGAFASLKVEITGNGDKNSTVLGDGITATITVAKVCSTMINAKEAVESYSYTEEYSGLENATAETETLAIDGTTLIGFFGLNNQFTAAEIGENHYSLTWTTPEAYDPRKGTGTYYGGWTVSPSYFGKTYWELDVEMYLYVTADGIYQYGVTFDGWSGYIQTIGAYSADGQGPLVYQIDTPPNNTGSLDVSKEISYRRGTESTLTVFGETFTQANTLTWSESETTSWSADPTINYSFSLGAFRFPALRTTSRTTSLTTASIGTVPASYVFPSGDPIAASAAPPRIGWRLSFHTPTIIDVFYFAFDPYPSGVTAPEVYVTSVAVNGTRFDRYIDGEYRRASYNPKTGAIVIAADDEQHICHF